jgi:hypothetical protein
MQNTSIDITRHCIQNAVNVPVIMGYAEMDNLFSISNNCFYMIYIIISGYSRKRMNQSASGIRIRGVISSWMD